MRDSWADAAKGSVGREETVPRLQHVRASTASLRPQTVVVPAGSCQGVWGWMGGLQQLKQCLCWSGAERQGSPVHETGERGVQEEFPIRIEDT